MKVLNDRFDDLIQNQFQDQDPIENYFNVNRKHKKKENKYINKSLKEILDETYGIMVYKSKLC